MEEQLGYRERKYDKLKSCMTDLVAQMLMHIVQVKSKEPSVPESKTIVLQLFYAPHTSKVEPHRTHKGVYVQHTETALTLRLGSSFFQYLDYEPTLTLMKQLLSLRGLSAEIEATFLGPTTVTTRFCAV